MNLRQMEVYRAVMIAGGVNSAAELLHVSPPTISKMLAQAAKQVGFALFERVNNRLLPTAEAMALYKESDAIFALHARLENRVRDFRDARAGRLSIVATPPLAYGAISPALSGFLPRRPQARARWCSSVRRAWAAGR